jgi:hypothetical protein
LSPTPIKCTLSVDDRSQKPTKNVQPLASEPGRNTSVMIALLRSDPICVRAIR